MRQNLRFAPAVLVAVIAVAIVLAFIRNRFRGEDGSKPPPFLNNSDLNYQLDVVSQQAGAPGRIIRVSLDGRQALTYACTDAEAAVVIFTLRDSKTHNYMEAVATSAKDAQGYEYARTLRYENGLNILSIQAGFANLPRSITITVKAAAQRSVEPHAEIVVTQLASPRRVMPAPDAVSANETDKILKVEADDATGVARISLVPRVATDEFDTVEVLGTSYLAVAPKEGSGFSFNSTYLGRGNDAVKVRLDRHLLTRSLTALTFKNARVEVRRGKRVLAIDGQESPDLLCDLHASITSLGLIDLPEPGTVHQGPGPAVQVRLTEPQDNQTKQPTRPQIYGLAVKSISPSLEEIGLDSLRVIVAPGSNRRTSAININVPARDTLLTSSRKAGTAGMTNIPEIKITFELSFESGIRPVFLTAPVHKAVIPAVMIAG